MNMQYVRASAYKKKVAKEKKELEKKLDEALK